MQQGTIARKMDKGFGFISREDEDKDLFFHANDLVDITFDELSEGDNVSFEIEEGGDKGPKAVKVTKI